LRDWVAKTEARSSKELQTELEGRCEFFGIIRDVANSTKHLTLRDPSTSVAGARDIHLREIGTAGYGLAGGYNRAGSYGPVLAIVIMPDGVAFAEAAAKVYGMWKEFFQKKGWDC
jgi:hypothetical protein